MCGGGGDGGGDGGAEGKYSRRKSLSSAMCWLTWMTRLQASPMSDVSL